MKDWPRTDPLDRRLSFGELGCGIVVVLGSAAGFFGAVTLIARWLI